MTTEDDIGESSGKLDELWAGAKYTNVNTPSGSPYSNGREEDVNGHKIAMKTIMGVKKRICYKERLKSYNPKHKPTNYS